MARQAIILDRDGVINQDRDDYVKSADEWRPIAGSLEAIARFKAAGLLVLVATNQSGLAHGLFTESALTAMHDKMQRLTRAAGGSIDDIAYCPHAPADRCQCRKPEPGLLIQLTRQWNIPPAQCCMVGDKPSDMAAARAVAMPGFGVRSGKAIDPRHPEWRHTLILDNLDKLSYHLIPARNKP